MAIRATIMAAAGLGVLLGVAGCSSSSSLTVRDALSSAQTARLALHLDGQGRSVPTTLSVTLADAADSLADDARELAVDPTTPHTQLAAVRDALDAVRLAQTGDDAAATALDAAIDGLESAG